MFAKLLNQCESTNEQAIFAPDVTPDSPLFGVLVNDGNANWVFFSSDHNARQFQAYCLSLGIATLRKQA
jgi:hypothetical protein